LAPGGENLARRGNRHGRERALGKIAAGGRKEAMHTGSRKEEGGPHTVSVVDWFGATSALAHCFSCQSPAQDVTPSLFSLLFSLSST
jgi:hypothetical protein